MKKNINNNNPDDRQIKELLSGTKLKAGDNLKYRIMHQIETEEALSRKAGKQSGSILGRMLSVFGVMYGVIALIGFSIYLSEGESALESATFHILVLLVTFICGLYWMITTLDDRRREKRKKTK